jgi:hypothetical protein
MLPDGLSLGRVQLGDERDVVGQLRTQQNKRADQNADDGQRQQNQKPIHSQPPSRFALRLDVPASRKPRK